MLACMISNSRIPMLFKKKKKLSGNCATSRTAKKKKKKKNCVSFMFKRREMPLCCSSLENEGGHGPLASRCRQPKPDRISQPFQG